MTDNGQQPVGKQHVDAIQWDPKEFPQLYGWEFKCLRSEFGYSARIVAEFFWSQGLSLSSPRSIYRIEDDYRPVKSKYVAGLRKLAGPDQFDGVLNRLRNQPGAFRERYVFAVLEEERKRQRSKERLEQRVGEWVERYACHEK